MSMAPVLEFLAYRLNEGRNPIGHFVDRPESLLDGLHYDSVTVAEWVQFVRELESGETQGVSRDRLLHWIKFFAVHESDPLTRKQSDEERLRSVIREGFADVSKHLDRLVDELSSVDSAIRAGQQII